MTKQMLGALIVILLMAGGVYAQGGPPPTPVITGDIVAQGLNGPQGVYVDSEGAVYVVEGGMGGDQTIQVPDPESGNMVDAAYGETSQIIKLGADGSREVVATANSLVSGQDVLGAARVTELDGTLYATVGGWNPGDGGDTATIPHFGEVVSIGDELTTVANFWDFEKANNPDQTKNLDSHPYDIVSGPDGMLYVADAAANDLLRLNPETGEIEVVAVFDGLPGVFPNPLRDGAMITDPVPTGVTFGSDGQIYASLLSGAPFIPGSAKVVQVADDGTVSDFATGLTMLTDVKTGPDGLLYATQFGVMTQEGPVFNSGAVLRIREDGTPEVVVEGLPFVTSIAFNDAGDAYVSINGAAIPGAGMVVRYPGLVEMAGEPLSTPPQS